MTRDSPILGIFRFDLPDEKFDLSGEFVTRKGFTTEQLVNPSHIIRFICSISFLKQDTVMDIAQITTRARIFEAHN